MTPDVGNMDEAGRRSVRKRASIFWGLFAFVCVSFIYGIFTNYSPSDVVIEYGGFVWVALAIAFLVYVQTRRVDKDVRIPVGKKVSGVIFVLVIIGITVIFSVPSLINTVIGDPFQAETIVVQKSFDDLGGEILKVANRQAIIGGIYTSKSVWKEVNRGDVVIVSGVRSVLGESIDTVTRRQIPMLQTDGLHSATGMGLKSPKAVSHADDDKDLLEGIRHDYKQASDAVFRGADVNTRTRDGATALQLAVMNGNTQIVELLLSKGANIHLKDKGGRTAFFLACAFGHLNMAELLARKGAAIDEPNMEGTTPLIAASLTGRTAVVQYLLDQGADVNSGDKLGNTALLAARKKSLRHQPDTVKLLEQRGATE